jgi:enoyl-CoA hydratase
MRAIGDVTAREMLLAAGVHGAQRRDEAARLSATRCCRTTKCRRAAQACAERIAALAPQRRAPEQADLRALAEPARAAAIDAGQRLRYAASPEHREGIAAFLEKRRPEF